MVSVLVFSYWSFFLCKLRQVPAHPWAAGVLHRALHGNLRAKLVIPWGHHGSSHVIPWPFTPSESHGFPTENFPWKKLFQNHGDMEKLFQNVWTMWLNFNWRYSGLIWSDDIIFKGSLRLCTLWDTCWILLCTIFARLFWQHEEKTTSGKKLQSERKQHLLTCQHIGFIVRSSSLSTSVDMSRASQDTRWHIVSVWGDKTNLVVLKTFENHFRHGVEVDMAVSISLCPWDWALRVTVEQFGRVSSLLTLDFFISKYIKCRTFIHSLSHSFIHSYIFSIKLEPASIFYFKRVTRFQLSLRLSCKLCQIVWGLTTRSQPLLTKRFGARRQGRLRWHCLTSYQKKNTTYHDTPWHTITSHDIPVHSSTYHYIHSNFITFHTLHS